MVKRALCGLAMVVVLMGTAAPAAAAGRETPAPAWRAGLAAARAWLGGWLGGWGSDPAEPGVELTNVAGEDGHAIDPDGLKVDGTANPEPPAGLAGPAAGTPLPNG